MAKRKDRELIRQRKREQWVDRTGQALGLSKSETEPLLYIRRTQSFRVNRLKASDVSIAGLRNRSLLNQPIRWCKSGYALENATERLADGHFLEEGVVYIQNAASWLPVLTLDPQPNEHILDVCAAPGGKAAHIQAITDNGSTLVCNDNSRPRLAKLQANMLRLGATAAYTLHDATKLSRVFEPYSFDRVLLDAPCSGEGLMTLHPEDAKLFDSWSVAHIRRLSALQKKILHESWQVLKSGGTLVYSTCTMAPEENEAVIDYFLRTHADAELLPITIQLEGRIPTVATWNNKSFTRDLSGCLRLQPSKLTEAFFVAHLRKTSD
jgi:NOL1/NOP2/sun family putative RNA methylase